ncbi:MAG TPA: hypothetical protein VMV59_08850 [Candidatus Dormibacteraeota bacterium]|nr:hypothetical protein [Candidatus Dormibacteraeota bacterium]
MRDLIHNQSFQIAFAPAVVTTDTAQVGNWINKAGFDSLGFSIFTGAMSGTPTFTVLVEEANAANQSDHADVAAGDLVSRVEGVDPETTAGNDLAAADAVTKIGYIGNCQYVRITVTPASNTSTALAAIATLGHASVRPVA